MGGGRKDILEQANPQLNNRVWTGGGTFSAHPLSMAAGLKTLEILKNSRSDYERINQTGTAFITKLNNYFREEKHNLVTTGYKSFITLHALTKNTDNPEPSEIVQLTDKKREALLQLALLNRNINGMHGIGALSFVHSNQHIHETQEVLENISSHVSNIEF